MRRARAWWMRLVGVAAGARREREMEEEFASHAEMLAEENERAGMTKQEARRRAMVKLGGKEAGKEAYRERGTAPGLERVAQDARYAVRQMGKNRGFTFTAVLMAALGVGAGTVIFGYVEAALLRPLPYREPGRLVAVTEEIRMMGRANLSVPDYLDWKRMNDVFAGFDVYTASGRLLRTPEGTAPVGATRVTDGFFRTLGVRPVLGRDFFEGEGRAAAANTAILSYGAWQRRFGGSADIIGRRVELSGEEFTIVGVLPKEFKFAERGNSEIWMPLHAAGGCDLARGCHALNGVARLKDGVSVEAARAEMKAIARRLEERYPGTNRGQGANVEPLAEEVTGQIRPIMETLFGAALVLLAIACVNGASLVLVRAENRRRETAVRRALGASRGRLAAQFATEGLMLAGIGGAIGLGAAWWGMKALAGLIPEGLMLFNPYLGEARVDGGVAAFALCAALLMGLVLAAVPALRISGAPMRDEMAEGGRGAAGNTWRRLGARMVVAELALAVTLLAGAGLLGKSLYRMMHVELGFRPEGLATMTVAAAPAVYNSDAASARLGREVERRVAALAGVESAAVTNILPVSGNGNTDWIRFAGRPYNGVHNEVNLREVSAGYFQTIGAKLVRGRYFREDEDASKPLVVIINEALARKYFAGQDPIGTKLGNTDLDPKSMKEIVGIVEDIRDGSLDSEIWPAVYYPLSQSPETFFSVVARVKTGGGAGGAREAAGAARAGAAVGGDARVDEGGVLRRMKAAIGGIDPGIGTMDETGMEERIENSPSAYVHRAAAWMAAGFAGLALLMGVAGLYGVVAYSVSRRTREIGVRMALGARREDVYGMVMREAGWLAAAGVGLGLVGAVGAGRLMRAMLYGVGAWDGATALAVVVVLGAAALGASFVPARRAAGVNPVEALRAE